MPFDAANPKAVKRREKEADMLLRQKLATIMEIMQTASGRLWMLDRLDKCFFNPFSTNSAQMAYNCGELNSSLRLLDEVMAACPDLYILMVKERNERDAARSRRDDSDNTDAAEPNGRVPEHPNLVKYDN